jgi:predicted site-specific integrase-resolvase
MRTAGHVPYRVVAYCRVSSQVQRSDLAHQRAVLEQFCAARGLANVEVVSEIGGGLNFSRKKFVTLMQAIDRYEVKTLVLVHQDRLVRFGFAWFAPFCADHGGEILVRNQDTLSPEPEMVQDWLTIVHGFSARLSGLRPYRQPLAEALKEPSA